MLGDRALPHDGGGNAPVERADVDQLVEPLRRDALALDALVGRRGLRQQATPISSAERLLLRWRTRQTHAVDLL